MLGKDQAQEAGGWEFNAFVFPRGLSMWGADRRFLFLRKRWGGGVGTGHGVRNRVRAKGMCPKGAVLPPPPGVPGGPLEAPGRAGAGLKAPLADDGEGPRLPFLF